MNKRNSMVESFWKMAVLVLILLVGAQFFLMYRMFSNQNQVKSSVPESNPMMNYPGHQNSRVTALPPMPSLNVNVMPGSSGKAAVNQPQNYNQNLISSLNQALAGQGLQMAPGAGGQNLNRQSGANRNMQLGGHGSMDPREEMARMREMMNQMMANALGGNPNLRGRSRLSGGGRSGMFSGGGMSGMATVKTEKDQYVITMNIPGLNKSEIKTEVNHDMLTISGIKREQVNNSGSGMYSSSQSCSSFQTSMNLPGPVNSEKMNVDYQNGILTIVAPKA